MPMRPPGGMRLFFIDNPACRRYNKYNWILPTKSVDTMKKQVEIMTKATGIETDLCGKCFAMCVYAERYLRSA